MPRRKVPRLRTPAGQRPAEQERPAPARPAEVRSFPLADEPAQLMYEAYSAHKNHREAGPRSPRLKHWHELSVYERSAFRAAFDAIRALVSGAKLVSVPVPPPDHLGIIISDPETTAFAIQYAPRPQLENTDDLVAAMPTFLINLDAAIARINSERAASARPRRSIREAVAGATQGKPGDAQ